MKVRKDAWSALAEMEPDVCDVERWGMVLRSIGTADEVPTEAAFVIGAALIEIGARLRCQFEAALAVAKDERAARCA